MDKILGLHGVFAVSKPAGPSSAAVVEQVKRAILGQKCSKQLFNRVKVGHGGTLDPMATGVLVIGLNNGCKRLSDFLKGPKIYEARAVFGVHYDTLDTTGKLIRQDHAIKELDAAALEAACARWTGDVMQKPPAFSAIRISGKRAYDLARGSTEKRPRLDGNEGPTQKVEAELDEPLEMAPRPVHVDEIKVTSIDGLHVTFRMTVGGGTYVRSLIRDIAKDLGTVAAMDSLCRVKQGLFQLEDALPIDTLSDVDALAKQLALPR